MFRQVIPSIMSNPKFKTKKVSLLINKDLFLLENNWRMDVLYQTIIFSKNQLFIWYFVFEVTQV